MACTSSIAAGLVLAFAAGAASACPRIDVCGGEAYERDIALAPFGPAAQHFGAACCEARFESERRAPRAYGEGGEIHLPYSFSYGAGGVGPIPSGGYEGGHV